ncbi:MAG: hypothetical protein QW222_02045 [Candidatus Bathyarchaeia archaeon]
MLRKYLLIAFVIAGIVLGYIGYMSYAPSAIVPTFTPTPTPTHATPTPLPPAWHLMIRSVFIWENGEEHFVAGPDSDLCNYLIQTIHRLNLQAKCVFTEERIQEIKLNDRIVELRFRFYENITIAQWVKPEDRDYIRTDENGYRILQKVKNVLFILEDNLAEGLEAHVLVYSLNEGWSCWAIRRTYG